MNWLHSNWIWLVIVVSFVAMHLFSHGGHYTTTARSRSKRQPRGR